MEYYTIKPITQNEEKEFYGKYETLDKAMDAAKQYLEQNKDTVEIRLFHTKITELDIIIKPKKQ